RFEELPGCVELCRCRVEAPGDEDPTVGQERRQVGATSDPELRTVAPGSRHRIVQLDLTEVTVGEPTGPEDATVLQQRRRTVPSALVHRMGRGPHAGCGVL